MTKNSNIKKKEKKSKKKSKINKKSRGKNYNINKNNIKQLKRLKNLKLNTKIKGGILFYIYGINYRIFIEYFYNQNEDNIFMPAEQTYPINKENLEAWKQKIKSQDTIETCEKISENFFNTTYGTNYFIYEKIYEDKFKDFLRSVNS